MRNGIQLVHVDEIIPTVLLGCETAFATSLRRALQQADRAAARDIIATGYALPGVRNHALSTGEDHVISGEALAYRRREFRPLVSGGSALRLTTPFHVTGNSAAQLDAEYRARRSDELRKVRVLLAGKPDFVEWEGFGGEMPESWRWGSVGLPNSLLIGIPQAEQDVRRYRWVAFRSGNPANLLRAAAQVAANAAGCRFGTENGRGADLFGTGIRAFAAGKPCRTAERALANLLASGSIQASHFEAREVDLEGIVACSRPRAGTKVDLVVACDDGSVCTCCTTRPVGGDFEIGDRVRAHGTLNQATNRIGQALVWAIAPNLSLPSNEASTRCSITHACSADTYLWVHSPPRR